MVMINVDESGKVVHAAMLEAPDRAIGEAVVKAVSKWPFTLPVGDKNRPVRLQGRLVFYFRIEHDQPTVIDPYDEILRRLAKVTK